MKKLAIYIHWPFCLSKCPYCDFNSRPLPPRTDFEKWLGVYLSEIDRYHDRLPDREITSVYFGGGTPSLMEPSMVGTMLARIAQHWRLSDDVEITLEANPATVSETSLAAFKEAGINRISLGVQSFDGEALGFLGRQHSAAQAKAALDSIASLYDRFTFDLIYARAGQTMDEWQKELADALLYQPKHLSLYQLTIEPRTVFYKRAQKETLTVDEDLATEMYELTQSVLEGAGLPAYEISNHAVPGEESRHNLTYWRYEDYIGIGPGAHGRFVSGDKRIATEAESAQRVWLGSDHPREVEELVLDEDAKQEALMMGLRLTAGIDKADWLKKFGTPLQTDIDMMKCQALVREGLLVDNEAVLKATRQGRQKLNAVLHYLL